MACDSRHDTVLRIGFNNDDKDHDDFERHFDMIVTGDASMCKVIELLKFSL